ncbi:MAG: C1 family peptidase [Prevotella sp.]|nr:C1 family peptidase [Prevotella sp.]
MLFVVLTLALLSCGGGRERFQVEVLNGFTPVKDQGKSQTCWAYAMLAAIETEHIMRGDSVNLSAAWVERMMKEHETAAPASGRAVGWTLISMIGKYGLVTYDAMKTVDDIPPRFAFMLGAMYTPLEFAHSVCAPGEWVALGSSKAHPYYEPFLFDVPDNWEHNRLLNLPMDSLLSVTERAVRRHHGICWEGDTSEQGFDWKQGVARTSLLQGSTTDDHCMAIVGLARDASGEPFFVMKNSWGTRGGYDGLLYMSFEYFKQKTLAIYMTREAAGW